MFCAGGGGACSVHARGACWDHVESQELPFSSCQDFDTQVAVATVGVVSDDTNDIVQLPNLLSPLFRVRL